jgi:UDP-N-acetylmuramoyl-L-alanine---L-glutamate ligase
MNPAEFGGKKILILGLGREGLSTLRFFLDNYPDTFLGVADRAEESKVNPEIGEILAQNPAIRRHLGENYLSCLPDYDIIVKSPGLPIHLPEIEAAFAQGKITSQTRIFFDLCPGTLIGVTGTKGKSTTSSIIYAILKRADKKVSLVGNIGTPMIDFLKEADPDTFFVCELSAHQLYDLTKSPRIAVLLNIYPEHLDYYKDFSEYIFAKANIAKFQAKSDLLIYNSANHEVAQIAGRSPARKIAFNEYDWKYNGKTDLIGKYNLENAKIGAIVGLELGIKDDDINAAIADFKPLDNRLEFVGNFNGADFYNDSLSTIQESAVAAIESFGPGLQTLIAGGFDRHQPFDKLAAAILRSRIDSLILFPTTGERIWKEIESRAANENLATRLAQLKPYFVEKMDEAVARALESTAPGRICALSAASASFGGFRDYAERGASFRASLIRQAKTSAKEPAVKL